MPRERDRPPDSDPVAASLLQLERSVEAIQDSDTFRAYLAAQARFPTYSWGNVLLIVGQNPAASRVAGYRTWQSLGRQVKRGEKAIRIIAPAYYKRKERDEQTGEETERQVTFFRSASVFDISQQTWSELWGSPSILVETVTVVGTIWSDAQYSYPRYQPSSSRSRFADRGRDDRPGPDRRHA